VKLARATAFLCAGASGLVLLFAAPAGATENVPPPAPRPNATTQPIADGCQRNPAGLLTYVYDYQPQYDPGKPRVAQGLITRADSGTGDLPEGHNWYDFSSDIKVDPQYSYLLAGDPNISRDATGAGNFADDPAILHVEWEEGTLPSWAWATESDRQKVYGRWVWDCGHWEEGFSTNAADQQQFQQSATHDGDYFLPGTGQGLSNGVVRGEQTEFHPLEASLVTRQNPTVPVVGESQADAFISSDGTPAAADSSCAHDFRAPTPANSPASFYGPDWTACVNTRPARNPVNTSDYSVFIPAPPKPAPDAKLRYRSVNHDPPGQGPTETVTKAGNGVQVTIPFQGFGSASDAQAFGKSLFLGWDGSLQFVPARVQVTFKKLTIHHSLDDPTVASSAQVPPGEWNLYSNLNGDWTLINDYAPKLGAVNSGDVLDLNHSYELSVPAGSPLNVLVRGRECDLPKINPCPNTTEVADDNDDPGTGSQQFASVSDAVGEHVLKPLDADGKPAADPNWELTYEVKQLSPAGKRNVCRAGIDQDTLSPSSRIVKRRTRVTKRRIKLRGRASDRDCGGRQLPKRVDVSIARKQGKRCRFLAKKGLAKPRPCNQPTYLRAKGKRRWHFRHRLPGRRGVFVITSRATDSAGNVEISRSKRNRQRIKRR